MGVGFWGGLVRKHPFSYFLQYTCDTKKIQALFIKSKKVVKIFQTIC